MSFLLQDKLFSDMQNTCVTNAPAYHFEMTDTFSKFVRFIGGERREFRMQVFQKLKLTSILNWLG